MLTNLPEYSITLGSHNFYCKLIYHHVIYTLVFISFMHLSSVKSILADSPTARGAVGQVLSFPAFGPITGKRKKKNPAFFFFSVQSLTDALG